MVEKIVNYSGTIRIKNHKTLQSWIDKGWYNREISQGYTFNIGCGRFTINKCTCSQCRNKSRPLLKEVLLKNKLIKND